MTRNRFTPPAVYIILVVGAHYPAPLDAPAKPAHN